RQARRLLSHHVSEPRRSLEALERLGEQEDLRAGHGAVPAARQPAALHERQRVQRDRERQVHGRRVGGAERARRVPVLLGLFRALSAYFCSSAWTSAISLASRSRKIRGGMWLQSSAGRLMRRMASSFSARESEESVSTLKLAREIV